VDLLGNITLNDGATLIIQGTSSCAGTITGGEAGSKLVINRAGALTMNTTTSPQLDAGAVLDIEIYGKYEAGAASETAVDLITIEGDAGSTLMVRGAGNRGRALVSAIDLTDQTTGDDLVVTVSGTPSDTATHITVTSGNLADMSWPITMSGDQMTIHGALAQGYNALALIAKALSGNGLGNSDGADKVEALDTTVQPNGSKVIGSTILIDSETVGVVHKPFEDTPQASASYTVFMVDRDVDVANFSDTEPYILTWGIEVGTSFQYENRALVWGGDDEPSTDNTVGGTPSTGKTECRRINFSGAIDSDYAEWRWIGSSNAAIGGFEFVSTTAQAFDNTLFYQPASAYLIETTSSGTITLNNCSLYNFIGPDSGNYGHWFVSRNTSDTSAFVVDRSVAIGLLDDFCFANDGLTIASSNNKVVDWGSGNFFDNNAGAVSTFSSTNDVLYGMGETPFQMDEATWTLTIDGTSAIGCGNALGRNTVDGHEADDSNALGFLLSGSGSTSNGLTVRNAKIDWPMWRVFHLQGVAASADTMVIDGTQITNYANYTEPGAQTWTRSAINSGGAIYAIGSGYEVVVESTVFSNPGRLGQDLSVSTKSSMGILLKGSGTGLVFDVRRCVFESAQAIAEGRVSGANQAYFAMDADGNGDWLWGGVSHSIMRDATCAFYIRTGGISHKLPIHHNIIEGDTSGTSHMMQFSETEGIDFRYNTVIQYNTGGYGLYHDVSTSSIFHGNLFLGPEDGMPSATEPIWMQIPEMDGSTFTYNYWAIDDGHIVIVSGSGSKSAAQVNAWSTGNNAGNAAVVSDHTAWQSVVSSITSPRQLTDSATRNLDILHTNPDGSFRDVGFHSIPAKGFGW
jgi:hypothetical protein